MIVSGKDRLKIIQNIIAQAGGIENVDLASELPKTLSALNGLHAQQQIAGMQNNAPVTPPQGAGQGFSGQPTNPAPEQANAPDMPPNDQNQPPMNEGQGALNLPQ